MLTVELGGEPLTMLPEGALHLPNRGWLVLADVHLGKPEAFRAAGVPVPGGVTAGTLHRLTRLVARRRPSRLLVLGDLLHARQGMTADLVGAVDRWRAAHAGLEITLVRGNHDRRAGDPPESWRMRCVDEPWREGSLAMAHDGDAADGRTPCLAGHVHPAVVVRDRDGFRARRPCFWLTGRRLVLPAFGGFTGAHAIRPGPGDRVFATDGHDVLEVTALIGRVRARP